MMKNQHGFILVMALLFLMLFSWLTIAALDASHAAQKSAGFQRMHNQLLMDAEYELALTEKLIGSHKINSPLASLLVTDQQLRTHQIPQEIVQRCENLNDIQKCSYIELLAQQQCFEQQTAIPLIINFYRITASAKIDSALTQEVILQSTFVLMPNGKQNCESSMGSSQLIYSGRQSWREI